MRKFFLEIRALDSTSGESIELVDDHQAIFVQSGVFTVGAEVVCENHGAYALRDTEFSCLSSGKAICISLRKSARDEAHGSIVSFEIDAQRAVFRLDQVRFPPGAIAYRHVHSGPGVRYLISGELEIQTLHGTSVMRPDMSWFEAANSPVIAISSTEVPTSFIRASVLPFDYLGKPSISYIDAADDDKPRLQANTRFFDQIIEFNAG